MWDKAGRTARTVETAKTVEALEVFRLGRPGRPGRLARLSASLRRLFGMPDYAAYLTHLSTHHPDRPLPTEREFFDEYLRARYGDGPTRCC